MAKLTIRVNLDTSSGLIDKEFCLNIDDKLEKHIKARMSHSLDLARSNSLKVFLNAYLQECFENIVKDRMIDNLLEKLENIEEKEK
jgi:hypothetical protein